MRIQELEIDRFGVWQDVSLPLNAQGLTVFYGPNEAGKSTLMRFVRGVLYGFQPRDEKTGGPDPKPLQCAGALRVEHEGKDYRLHRVSSPGTRGRLEINGRSVVESDPLLQKIVGGASEALFENIFAIGLHELQQLATLNGDDVARHIYGLSLGPDGERILRAQSDFDLQSQRLLATDQRSGEVIDLLKRLEQIDQTLERQSLPSDRYNGIMGEQKQTEGKIESLKRRQSTLQQNLRGLQFLHRAWGPWNRQREIRRVLDQTRISDRIRPETLDRHDALELELSEFDRKRKDLLDESRRLLKQADSLPLRPDLEEHACEIRSLESRAPSMQEIERGGRGAGSAPQQPLPAEITSLLGQISPRWDIQRLKNTQLTPASMQDLLKAAERFQTASRRRARTIKAYKRLSSALQKKQSHWAPHKARWGNQTPLQLRHHGQQRLNELEDLRELRLQREHLNRAVQALGDGTEPLGPRIPELFRLFLLFFSIAGVCLLGGGLYAAMHNYEGIVAGGPVAWIAGGCLFLLGVGALAVSRTLRQQARHGMAGQDGLKDEQHRLLRDLERVNQSIDRLTRKDALKPPLSHALPLTGETTALTERDVIQQIQADLIDIDQYERDSLWIEQHRRTQSSLRQKLQVRQREVSTRRREWGELLKRLGLDESLKMKDAFQTAGKVLEARHLYEDWLRSQTADGYERRQLEEFRKQLQLLCEQLKGPGYRPRDPYIELAQWGRDLQAQAELRKERALLRQKAKEKHQEAGRVMDRVTRLRDQLSALLASAGVRSRDEIVLALKSYEKQSDLERQLTELRRELDRISQSEPDLAIVEEDLIRFDPARHEQNLSQTRRDLESVDLELRGLYETLGQYKRQLREIEDDRSNTSLRYEKAHVLEALREATERWCSVSLADGLVSKLRERVEKNKQPELLQHASSFLRQLTCGKYKNIWTPLGERRLVIDDDAGHSLRIEQLSSGTREQVFLAIRMAMIRSLASQGTVLPMVLDDVTVNFDQTRTEAAVSTLIELAEQGQQVLLFTCHLHLSHIFQNQGIEPVWLPGLRTGTSVVA